MGSSLSASDRKIVGNEKVHGSQTAGSWRSMKTALAKVVLAVIMMDSELECVIDQLCSGLRAGIEGACTHCVQSGI